MSLQYDGWCRRIDLSFRSRYPYINTRIFKLNDHEFQIFVAEDIKDFFELQKIFNHEIKFLTAPVKLVDREPSNYITELKCIEDKDIPSKFEGFPLTMNQIYNHIFSIHPKIKISGINEDHQNHTIIVKYIKEISDTEYNDLQKTLDALKSPYPFQLKQEGDKEVRLQSNDEVFHILSSKSRQSLNCTFLERDERFWFDNVEGIYKGTVSKDNLYFIKPNKTSCLVNFSKFQNANLRNHLLLYDIVYCVLPLAENMGTFLHDQKISKAEILHLVERGRLIILNMQPESRLDYGFLNEAFQTNSTAVVSRRALSALCAIDLVAMNKSYLFSNPELSKLLFPLMQEIATITGKDINTVSNFLLWPKQALRASLDTLNEAGPMGISRYGVNKPIIEGLPSKNKEEIEFEFIVNSDQIHLAHALDATYFPFFISGQQYSDHPYALIMGNMLNFFKTTNLENLGNIFDSEYIQHRKNLSIDLISSFDVNDYIPIHDFEDEISSSVIRSGMNSLFSELSLLEIDERNKRISIYNTEVEKALSKKNVTKHLLDLGEDGLGMVIPLLGSVKKLSTLGTKKAMQKFPAFQSLSEFIEDKTGSKDQEQRNVSILTQINRVARLKRSYD